MASPIRILVLDDHSIFRDTLVHMFSTEPDFLVVGHHATVEETIRTLSEKPVDVVLLDFDLRVERGSALISWAANEGFAGQFLVVTAGLDEADAAWLIQHQVAGIFLKENPFPELLSAIRTVARGSKWLDQPFLKMLMASFSGSSGSAAPLFSARELDALRLLIEGCTNKQIADRLGASEVAVKATVQRLFDKAGVRNRGQLIRVAIQKYQNYL